MVLILCISGVGLAMEWTLSGGVQYQYGNYNVTVIESGAVAAYASVESESDSFDISVPAPKLNYTLNISSGNWVGSAFYGNSGSVEAKLPEDYLDPD